MSPRSWSRKASPAMVLALAGLALQAAPSAAREPIHRTWDRSFSVAGHPTVHVLTNDGRVTVHTGPAGTVQCHVEYQQISWGLSSSTHDPRVEMTQNGGEVTITAREPSTFMLFGAVETRLQVNVTLPASCDLTVESGDGSVTLEQPIEGRIDISTGDGRVVAHGTRGDIHIRTGDGAVTCDSLDGRVSLRSGDGRIRLSGRFDVVEEKSGDGHVEITANPGSRMASDWLIQTSDGPLTVRIPQDFNAELDAHAGDGTIHFELPVSLSGPLDRHTIRGLINAGGPVLRLRTSDGALTIATSD